MITKFYKGKQKIKVIKNSKMDFYLVAGSRSFAHVQISWLVRLVLHDTISQQDKIYV